MTEDASLDQFVSSAATESDDADSETGESENERSESEDSEVGEAESEDSEVVESEVEDSEPAVSTYEWSPEGGECADCGASVEKRWRAEGQRDGDFVCADCKEW